MQEIIEIEKTHTVLTKCPVCKDNNLAYSNNSLRNDYSLGVCNTCNFKYAHPRPKIEFLVDYYNSISSVRFYKESDEKALKDTKKLNRMILKNHPEAKNILEIGCSTGYYLRGLKLRGFEVCGSELSEDAVNLAREWYNVEVFASEFPPPSHLNKYDVIIIHHVIEHVMNPKDFLEQASNYLSDKGIFIIETPNVNSMGIKLFRNNYPVFCPPGHLNFFSKSTLEKVLPENHKPLESKTASANGYVIYNCINAFLATINLKGAIDNKISKKETIKSNIKTKASNNRKYSYLKMMYKFSKITQTILYPFFFLIDKAGLGENLSLVSRIKKNNLIKN